jgi:hypothetical protein
LFIKKKMVEFKKNNFTNVMTTYKWFPNEKNIKKINNLRMLNQTVILHEIRVQHNKNYPVPIMIPKLEKDNLEYYCDRYFSERREPNRKYIPSDHSDFYKIKCNF